MSVLKPSVFFAAVVLAAALAATPAAAAPPSSPQAHPARPVIASYWAEFVDHWTGKLKEQNSIVLCVLGVGAVGLFIITRGKWMK